MERPSCGKKASIGTGLSNGHIGAPHVPMVWGLEASETPVVPSPANNVMSGQLLHFSVSVFSSVKWG